MDNSQSLVIVYLILYIIMVKTNLNYNVTVAMEDMEGNMKSKCPSSKECMLKCPLGHKKDQNGCPICDQCESEGMFEGDIMVNSKL